jgi:hypothetical protein
MAQGSQVRPELINHLPLTSDEMRAGALVFQESERLQSVIVLGFD